MPLVRVEDQDHETLWEGEGYLDLSFSTCIVQTERRENVLRSRSLDLGGLLQVIPYTVFRELAPVWVFLDPDPDPLTTPIPDPENLTWVLWLDRPPGELRWLKSELERPIVLPEEQEAERERQRAEYEERLRQMRQFELSPREVREGFGLAPRADVMDDLDRLREAMSALHEMQPNLSRFQEAVTDMAQAVGRLRESCGGPDPAHDELIESTRSVFPHDPHHYDYPRGGDNRMQWTPPDDPDEKVRSCP